MDQSGRVSGPESSASDQGDLTGLPDLPDLVQVRRFVAVMQRLRTDCPWDAEQTHRSLVPYLIEEAGEVIDAIETGDSSDLREELGDLLLQVVFHATIGAETGAFDLDEVARGIADKLIDRHPYVFAEAQTPDDLMGSWEQRKRAEKARTSALDGIAEHLSALARATKVISRTRSHQVPVELASEPVNEDQLGNEILSLVARGQANGIDPEQAVRAALRELEARIRAAEGEGPDTAR